MRLIALLAFAGVLATIAAQESTISVEDAAWPRDRALALLREPGHRTVAGGRPLVYLFEVKRNGALPMERIAEFRRLAAAGGADPYLVYMGWEIGHSYLRQAVFPTVATADELAGHLARAIAFVRADPAICPANTAVAYAWNEHDEGGWRCPTWTPKGPDTSRLDAIRRVLRPQP